MFVHLPTKIKPKMNIGLSLYIEYNSLCNIYIFPRQCNAMGVPISSYTSISFICTCMHTQRKHNLPPIQEEKGREGTDYKRQNNNAKLC